jgi:glycosyltransferase involved in cell wall biosynthesis
MKVAIITCYKYPDYGRAVSLRAALMSTKSFQTIVIKNSYHGLLRYPEVLIKTCKAKLRDRPDMYLITFRGYEILPFVLLLAQGKPVILDELVNPLEVVHEHQLHKRKLKGRVMALWSVFAGIYRWLLRRCELVIADTTAQATYSSKLSGIPISRYRVIPVGADERIFKPVMHRHDQQSAQSKFTVLYYGSMVPLHGLSYVLGAARLLKDRPDINFLLVGGNSHTVQQIDDARQSGAHIDYLKWIEPNKLPAVIAGASLCLGGPFGNTKQSQLVITGKTYQLLASAAPVLIGKTKVLEANKLFSDKVNCLMVPQANPKAIVEAIIWAEAHASELETIGHAGNKLYNQHFSESVISFKLVTSLKELG